MEFPEACNSCDCERNRTFVCLGSLLEKSHLKNDLFNIFIFDSFYCKFSSFSTLLLVIYCGLHFRWVSSTWRRRRRRRIQERGGIEKKKMGDQMAKGEEMEKKAEKKIDGWGLFGSKYEDAADLYDKSANFYKLAKSWDKAGAVYIKLANCHLKLESKHEAASAYVDASKCYKKISAQESITCLNQAINLFMEIGRLNMAARYCKEIGELYELEKNIEQAMDYYERSADLFQSEEVTTSANQCKQKVAQFAAQLEQYPKAIEIFETIARHSMNNNLLKYSVRGILLNAGLCQLCQGDFVAITNSLERYQELDLTFSGTREYKFLSDLAASIDEEDVAKFTDVVKEFDSMTRLDTWKTALLLRAKTALKAKEVEEDDLT